MRLTEWRKKAPVRDAIDDRVMAVLGFLLSDFGADPDPECHLVWGDHPDLRYSVLVPVAAGLVSIAVRTQDARATARLIRWPKLAIGEFSVEATGERRVVAVQVESYVLKGSDAEADLVAEFVRGLVLRADNLATTPVPSDLAGALAESLGRVAIPAAMAPAGTRAAAARPPAAASRAAAGRKAAPAPIQRPAPPPRSRELPEGIAPRPAAVRATPRAMAPEAAPVETPAQTPVGGPDLTAAAVAAEAPVANVVESMALVAVETQREADREPPAEPVSSSADAEPTSAPLPAAPPRKPRVPRVVSPDAASKPKRPRRVHRDWPEPAGAPGWDAPRPTEDPRARKKPPRWVP